MTQKKTKLLREQEDQRPIRGENLSNRDQISLKERQREILLLIGSKQLEQTVADIQIVRKYLNDRNTIAVIAESMNRTEEYILLIAMNIQSSFLEDDITIARRIMLDQ